METLRNLDRVLGVKQQTMKIRRPSPAKFQAPSAVPNVPQVPQVPQVIRTINFPDFVEKLNGRCAVSGLIIGKSVYQFSGNGLIEQLLNNPDMAMLYVSLDIAVITLLTTIFYKNIDYNNAWEFGEIVMYRFAMGQWLYIMCGYLF